MTVEQITNSISSETRVKWFNLCSKGKAHEVLELLNQYPDLLELQNNHGSDGLHNAIMSEKWDIVDALLEKQANVNSKDNNQVTPLHHAISQDRLDLVKILIKRGANVNDQNKEMQSCLHYAANNGNLDIINELLDKGAITNVKDSKEWTPLNVAAVHNRPDVVKTLLEVELKNQQDNTSQNIELSLNIQNKYGNTPIYTAINRGNTKVIDLLLSYNPNMNLVNAKGLAPLHTLCNKIKEGIEVPSGYIFLSRFPHLDNIKNIFKNTKELILDVIKQDQITLLENITIVLHNKLFKTTEENLSKYGKILDLSIEDIIKEYTDNHSNQEDFVSALRENIKGLVYDYLTHKSSITHDSFETFYEHIVKDKGILQISDLLDTIKSKELKETESNLSEKLEDLTADLTSDSSLVDLNTYDDLSITGKSIDISAIEE